MLVHEAKLAARLTTPTSCRCSTSAAQTSGSSSPWSTSRASTSTICSAAAPGRRCRCRSSSPCTSSARRCGGSTTRTAGPTTRVSRSASCTATSRPRTCSSRSRARSSSATSASPDANDAHRRGQGARGARDRRGHQGQGRVHEPGARPRADDRRAGRRLRGRHPPLGARRGPAHVPAGDGREACSSRRAARASRTLPSQGLPERDRLRAIVRKALAHEPTDEVPVGGGDAPRPRGIRGERPADDEPPAARRLARADVRRGDPVAPARPRARRRGAREGAPPSSSRPSRRRRRPGRGPRSTRVSASTWSHPRRVHSPSRPRLVRRQPSGRCRRCPWPRGDARRSSRSSPRSCSS